MFLLEIHTREESDGQQQAGKTATAMQAATTEERTLLLLLFPSYNASCYIHKRIKPNSTLLKVLL